jgi:carbonic anhydrase/acetyltransferase-like protein (isoleucine patch superfamily)
MLREFHGHRPVVPESAYVDPSAQLIGRVVLGERASVWCNVTIRGDVNAIRIGDDTNIQDNSCLHVDRDKPLEIGAGVVVGHCSTVHGCVVESGCLIGMGSTLLSGARIGAGSIIAAGSLVLEGQEIPPRSLVMGAPAKVRRPTTDEEIERIRHNAQNYVQLSREYLGES